MKKIIALLVALVLTLSLTAAFADGITIAVPNDPTNEGRALLLLQAYGLITVDENAGITATVADITENPLNIEFVEVEAALVPNALPDVDYAAINGNYALAAGLNASTNALAVEDASGDAAQTYANIIAVRRGDEGRAEIQALVAALQAGAVDAYNEQTGAGIVGIQ